MLLVWCLMGYLEARALVFWVLRVNWFQIVELFFAKS